MKKIRIIIMFALSVLAAFCMTACTEEQIVNGIDYAQKLVEAENAVQTISAWLDNEIPNTAVENLTLPTTHPNRKCTIVWKSSNEEALSSVGVYTKPSTETKVILTATITVFYQASETETKPVIRTWESTITVYGEIPEAIKTSFDNIDFQLPEENKAFTGNFELPTNIGIENAAVIWKVRSEKMINSISVINNVIQYQKPDYTAMITFVARITYDKKSYEREYVRPIQGIIDMPDYDKMDAVIDKIPEEPSDNYTLPGKYSLESSRSNYSSITSKDISIAWSVIDGDESVLTSKNQLDRKNVEKTVMLRADFVFEGYILHTREIERTVPAASKELQQEYLANFLETLTPTIISGTTYFPSETDKFGFSFTWRGGIGTSATALSFNHNLEHNVEECTFDKSGVGYMELGTAIVSVKQDGKAYGNDRIFNVKLVGDGQIINESNRNDVVPDTALWNALLEVYDDDGDRELNVSDLSDEEATAAFNYSLDLSSRGINNLMGLELCTEVKSVNLANNNKREQGLENLSAVIPTLKDLSLDGNSITSIAPLSGYTNLVMLYLSENPIGADITALTKLEMLALNNVSKSAELDLRPIKKHVNMQYLLLDGNSITSPMQLIRMKQLSVLSLANNNISSLSALANKSMLKYLDLDDNCVDSVADLTNLSSLKYLYLANNDIVGDLPSSLSQLQGLTTLILSGNDIRNTEANPLSASIGALVNLKELSLAENGEVKNLDFLSMLTKLTKLDVSGCNLINGVTVSEATNATDEDGNVIYKDVLYPTLDAVSPLTALTALDISDNVQLESIGMLGSLINLNEFYADNLSKLSSYGSALSQFGRLKYLSLKNTGIQTFSWASGLGSNLVYLDSTGHKASIIDASVFSSKTNLTYLYLSSAVNSRMVNALKISNLSALRELSLRNVQLDSFKFIDYFDESHAQLKYLDLANTGLNLSNSVLYEAEGGGEPIYIWSMLDEIEYLSVANNSGLVSLEKLFGADGVTDTLNALDISLNNVADLSEFEGKGLEKLDKVYLAVSGLDSITLYKNALSELVALYENDVKLYVYLDENASFVKWQPSIKDAELVAAAFSDKYTVSSPLVVVAENKLPENVWLYDLNVLSGAYTSLSGHGVNWINSTNEAFSFNGGIITFSGIPSDGAVGEVSFFVTLYGGTEYECSAQASVPFVVASEAVEVTYNVSEGVTNVVEMRRGDALTVLAEDTAGKMFSGWKDENEVVYRSIPVNYGKGTLSLTPVWLNTEITVNASATSDIQTNSVVTLSAEVAFSRANYLGSVVFSVESEAYAKMISDNEVKIKDVQTAPEGAHVVVVATYDGVESKITLYLSQNYRIYNAAQLMNMPMSGNVYLMSDINLNGAYVAPFVSFGGIFYGQNKTIANFNISNTDGNNRVSVAKNDRVGLFGENRGTIKDVVISGASVFSNEANTSARWTNNGVLCGFNFGTITNVTVKNSYISIAQIYSNTGGIVGHNSSGIVADCTFIGANDNENAVKVLNMNNGVFAERSTSNVIGDGDVGGIVGINNNSGTVRGCSVENTCVETNQGVISRSIGGVVGLNTNNALVESCTLKGYFSLVSIGKIAMHGGYIIGTNQARMYYVSQHTLGYSNYTGLYSLSWLNGPWGACGTASEGEYK